MFYPPKTNASAGQMLSTAQLAALSARVGANADRIIQTIPAKTRQPASIGEQQQPTKLASATRRGRPAKRITNPFFGLIGPKTEHGRYPPFAMDIVEGIARLDWHDRPLGKGGSSKPLSVRSLMGILESVEEVTADSVAAIIRTKTRHAQRYVKAIELAMPFLMKARPKSLVFEMDLPEDEFVNAAYQKKLCETHLDPLDDIPPPTPEDLAKLHRDLGYDAFDSGRGINAAYSNEVAPNGDHRRQGGQTMTASHVGLLRPVRDGVPLAVA